MQVWNVLPVADWKYRTQKWPKIRHLGTVTQLCRAVSLQLRHVSTIGKKLVKQQHLLHVSSQYGELRLSNHWDPFGSFGHPSKFQRLSRLWLRYCSDIAHWRPSKLWTIFGRFLGCHTIYTFWGLLSPNGILPAAKFTLRPSLAFFCIASVNVPHYSSGRQPNCGMVQGMELRNFCKGHHGSVSEGV